MSRWTKEAEGPGGEGRVRRWTRAVVRRRVWVLGVAGAVAAAAGAGIPKLGLSSNYRTFFSDDNPDLVAYDEVENVYTKNDNVLFVVKPRSGDVFTPRTLELVRSLVEDAWQIPYATRVDGVTNYQHTWARGDELVVEDLVSDGPIAPVTAERARRVALGEPLLAGRLVARDAATTGVNVRVTLPGESEAELPETAGAVEALVDRYRERYPDHEIHTTGIVMINHAFATAPLRDGPTVMPAMFAVLVMVMIWVLRSVGATAGTLAVILLSTVTAVGAAGHLGVLLDPTSASAPTIILTLAVADSVHILITWLQGLREGRGRQEALFHAMEVNAMPVFLTSVTTAIGFLTLNFSDSPPFRLLGNVTAFGVVVAWAYSMTVLPALASFLPGRPGTARATPFGGVIERTSRFVRARHRAVLVGAGAVALLLASATALNRVNDQYAEYFSRALPFRVGTDFATEHLVGIYGATFSIDSGESQGVADPDFLHRVDRFTDWLEARPDVAHVNSFTRVMKRLNMNMHGDDPAFFRLPDEQDLAAQYLFLYELSLPYGLDVNDQIDVDKRSLRVDVTYGDIDVARLEAETDAAEAWLDRHGTEPMSRAVATGPALMFSKITRRNIGSMMLGTGLGFLLIAAILTLALGSVRMGVLSLIPNVLPAAMAFGAWGLLVGEVGFAVSVVAGLSIGIIVDDTVHFLSKYDRARRSTTSTEAVAYAFRTVGAAILGNTLIVAAGFAVLGMSTFRVTATMGLLTALVIVCALAVDFLLLPALLIEFDRRPVAPRISADTPQPRRTTMLTSSPTTAAAAAGILAVAAFTAPLSAQTTDGAIGGGADAADRGHQVALEADRRDSGWGATESVMRMTLRNRSGDESTRALRRQALEVAEQGSGDRSLIVFDSPRDIEGTALLSHARILEPDDQWLFLPALRRVKRIQSANKSGPFVGSEFAFEDLVSQEVEKYDYRFLREEPCGALACAVVERHPRYENSGYTRQVVWWDTGEHRIQRIDYYDRRDALLKTLTYDGYRSYGDYWRPDRMTMVNHQNGKSTVLEFDAWDFDVELDDGDFTPSRLRRVR